MSNPHEIVLQGVTTQTLPIAETLLFPDRPGGSLDVFDRFRLSHSDDVYVVAGVKGEFGGDDCVGFTMHVVNVYREDSDKKILSHAIGEILFAST